MNIAFCTLTPATRRPCDFRGDVDMYDVHVTRTGTEQANPLA
eukprot:CAMPEP_0114306514 /NCGR_PEP_ID=MMETSP0059-20121206/16946_1 /TAXON_ID=36894 /ORGANISM="Pyramimonas parkeae, Strain CCMP726" /LENGTH=41 /DNA_ID= /DNA_START= /DNA_END= /DNA_ORIENTATION=